MNSKPLLLFGAAGQTGRELADAAAERGRALVGLARADCDVTDEGAVAAAIARAGPALIVNAAAYTAVDRAESEPDAAFAANARAPAVIAQCAAAAGVPLLHLSTDYVFDGAKDGPYREDDSIAPLGVYGRSKAQGEAQLRAALAEHVILRTAWVYGRHGSNFLKTMLRLAAERDVLRVVADQRGSPTATRDIAEAILAVDAALTAGARPWGTYHFAGTGATSWHGFAEAIVAEQVRFTGRRPSVEAIATADYPTAARRPSNSVLDSARFALTFGHRARPWRERTAETVAILLGEQAA